MSAEAPDAARLRRTWPQRLLITFNLLAVVGLLGAAGGLGYLYQKFGQLPRLELGTSLSSDQEIAGDAENYLVVGVDSAEGLDPDDPVRAQRGNVGGLRSDTIMILHVDPAEEQALLLSLPRDLWVPIAGTNGNRKINSAIGGGPERLIATIQQYFNIPVNHYVQVDFAGFADLVDAVDGVPVYFPDPARDRESGLSVPEAGCVTLRGGQALGYVRSRAFEQRIDGRWRFDGSGDLGRVSRQQDFIRRALRRAVSEGVRNPTKLDALIDVGLDAVTVDDELTGEDILDLGRRFRSFDPADLELFSLPVVDDRVGGAAVLRLLDTEAEPILDRFRGLEGSEVTESGVRVRVLNGSGAPNQATEVTDELSERGFGVSAPGDHETTGIEETEIHYPPGNVDAAHLVERYMAGGAELVLDEGVSGGDVVLVTGLDFTTLRSTPAPSTSTTSVPTTAATPAPGDEPEEDTADDTSDDTATSSTTTTTMRGVVPGEPPPGVRCG